MGSVRAIVVRGRTAAITVGRPGPAGPGGIIADFDATAPEDLAVGALYYRAIDTTAPAVTAFALPATAAALLVDLSALLATDARGVTGYYLSESPITPGAGAAGWSATPQTQWSFAGQGVRVLYAWAKDAAGNISAPASASVEITLPNQAPGATIAITNQSAAGFTAAGTVYGIGADDTLTKIRVAWQLQGTDADAAAAVAAGRYADLTAGADLTAYQGAGKAITSAMPMGSYIPYSQLTETKSEGGSQTGDWTAGAQFVVTLTAPIVTAVAGDAQVTLAWPTVPGATSYYGRYTSDGSTPSKTVGIQIGGGSAIVSGVVVSGLSANTAYNFVVWSANSGGESIASTVAAQYAWGVLWTEPFSNLTEWVNPIDSLAAFSVVSGAARSGGAASAMRRLAAVTAPARVDANVKRNAAGSGPRIYVINGTSIVTSPQGYLFSYLTATGKINITRKGGTGDATLAEASQTLTPGQSYTWGCEVLPGGIINFYIDGILKLTTNDTQHTSFGNVALYNLDANTTDFDDVVVRD